MVQWFELMFLKKHYRYDKVKSITSNVNDSPARILPAGLMSLHLQYTDKIPMFVCSTWKTCNGL